MRTKVEYFLLTYLPRPVVVVLILLAYIFACIFVVAGMTITGHVIAASISLEYAVNSQFFWTFGDFLIGGLAWFLLNLIGIVMQVIYEGIDERLPEHKSKQDSN